MPFIISQMDGSLPSSSGITFDDYEATLPDEQANLDLLGISDGLVRCVDAQMTSKGARRTKPAIISGSLFCAFRAERVRCLVFYELFLPLRTGHLLTRVVTFIASTSILAHLE